MQPEYRDHWPCTRRFTVDEVYRMVEVGILEEDDHLELLDGELVPMSPQGDPHTSLVPELRGILERAFGPGFHVRDHSPVWASEHDLPEPDLAVLRGEPRDYVARPAKGPDVPLVVEVTYSSHWRDHRKARIYAAGGFACYWIVDMTGFVVEVYTEPTGDRYTRVARVGPEDPLVIPSPTPVTLDASTILDWLSGRRR